VIRIGNKDLESPGTAGVAALGGPVPAGGIAGGGMGGGGGPCGPGGACGAGGAGSALGLPAGGDPSQLPPAFLAGVTAPQYGMPHVGTPIGLPGPAHVPLGIPAGLQRHSITNHTKMHIPPPSRSVGLHVQQYPGLSYPKPARHAYVAERHDVPHIKLRQPPEDRTRFVDNGGMDPDSLGEGVVVGGGHGRFGGGTPCPPEPLE
jgi:hypothetical protein